MQYGVHQNSLWESSSSWISISTQQQANWSGSNKLCLPTFSKSVHVRERAGKQNDARALSILVMMINKQKMAACLQSVHQNLIAICMRSDAVCLLSVHLLVTRARLFIFSVMMRDVFVCVHRNVCISTRGSYRWRLDVISVSPFLDVFSFKCFATVNQSVLEFDSRQHHYLIRMTNGLFILWIVHTLRKTWTKTTLRFVHLQLCNTL